METRNIFDGMASRYDTGERIANANIIAGAIRAELGDMAGKQGIDYGCGTGLVGLSLVDLFDSLLFVDTAPQMIAQVRQKIAQAGIANADTLCADFCVEVPPGLAADCVLVSQVLLHVKDVPLLLRRLYGVLRPGGHLALVDFDKNEKIQSDKVHNGFDQLELSRLLSEIGFVPEHAYTFHHGEKMFMHEDASLFLIHATKG